LTAGYSGTPLPRKLGVKEAHRVLLVDPPGGFALDPLPAGATVERRRESGASGDLPGAGPGREQPSEPLQPPHPPQAPEPREPPETYRSPEPYDIVLAFFGDAASLRRAFAGLRRWLDPAGGLWIAWPKKASGVPTDLTENVVREVGLAEGLVDTKVCAVDGVWSGLRFVVRLADRPSVSRARA
jgi:hypothetical protein